MQIETVYEERKMTLNNGSGLWGQETAHLSL